MSKQSLYINPDFIRRLKLGDRETFTELVYHFTEKISNTCRRMNLNHEDAQEVCQDVFMKLWENREHLDEEGALKSYIFTMAKNNILKQFRKRAYTVVLEKYWKINTPNCSPSSVEHLESKELEEYSNEFIEKLPEKQKEILKLRINKYLSNEEIAIQLQLSKRTVENQVYRALKKLKKFIAVSE